MERKNNELFNAIDVENLFSQWHPDIRKFTRDINQYCVLNLIKTIKESSFDTSKHSSALFESYPDTDIENGTSVRTTDGADISVFA